jgi:hypothetical protein
MDTRVWIKFEDDTERYVHVDDVLKVEVTFNPSLDGGNVLVDFDDHEEWAYLTKDEALKVEKYHPKIVEWTDGLVVSAKAIRRRWKDLGFCSRFRRNNFSVASSCQMLDWSPFSYPLTLSQSK